MPPNHGGSYWSSLGHNTSDCRVWVAPFGPLLAVRNHICFTHQQARTLLFARGAKKPLFPFLHLWCRGWVGGSPLSLEPTGVKHYAREADAKLGYHVSLTSRLGLFFLRAERKNLCFPFCTCGAPRPLHIGPSTNWGCRSRNVTRQGRWGVRTENFEALRRWGNP